MPTTVNGIGTMYYGKRHREEFHGTCESCGFTGPLTNYQTRLWFTFVFVPLIPLGKKQILELCPRCSRHKAIPLAEWERITQQAIEQSGDQLAANQDDPDAAVNMHLTLAAFKKDAEADRLAQIMRDKFPENVNVLLYLAGYYDGQGKPSEAGDLIRKAYDLEPDNPATRRALGVTRIEEERLDEAKDLLAPLRPPAEAYDPGVFFLLGKGYQQQGRHAEALDEFREIAGQAPQVIDEPEFRKAVKQSEKALGRTESLVPKRSLFASKAFWWTTAAVVLVAAILGWNQYIKTHRTVYVVNGLNEPIQVEITTAEGADPQSVTVPPTSRTTVTLAEGPHRARVVDPADTGDPVDFNLEGSYFSRFFSSPAFLLDPGRSAVVVWEEAVYTSTNFAQNEPRAKFHVGQPFTVYSDVDYFFEEFPASLKSKSNRVKKDRVAMIEADAGMIVFALPQVLREPNGTTFLEQHLRRNPASEMLLSLYVKQLLEREQLDRGREFLATRLDERPMVIEWHRVYQNVAELSGHGEEVAQQYQAFVDAEPNNAALLYLRGRIVPEADEAIEWSERSIQADPSLHWGYATQGYLFTTQGRFEEAVKVYQTARAKAPEAHQGDIDQALWGLRTALGEADAVATELQARLAEQPFGLRELKWLMNVEASRGDLNAAARVIASAEEELRKQGLEDPVQMILRLKLHLAYLKGDFDKFRELAAQVNDSLESNVSLAFAAAESGQFADAVPLLDRLPKATRILVEPALWLAALLEENPQEVERWRPKAIATLREEGLSERAAAEMLARLPDGKVSDEELASLTVSPLLKTLVLCLAAAHDEEHRAERIELAEKLNFPGNFPHHLIERAVERWQQ